MVIIAIAIENTMMHIADEVAHSTPLVTVLFFEIVSREASAHLSFSALSAAPVISPEKNFRIKGNRNASDITPNIRQRYCSVTTAEMRYSVSVRVKGSL